MQEPTAPSVQVLVPFEPSGHEQNCITGVTTQGPRLPLLSQLFTPAPHALEQFWGWQFIIGAQLQEPCTPSVQVVVPFEPLTQVQIVVVGETMHGPSLPPPSQL